MFSKKAKTLKQVIIKAGLLCFFIIVLVVLSYLKKDVEVCETYTRTFGRFYSTVIGTIFKFIPFSMMEVLTVIEGVIVLISLIFSIVRLFKLKLLKALSSLLTSVCIVTFVVSLYFATSEMAYNRKGLPVNYYSEKVEKENFGEILDYFISDLNTVSNALTFKEDGELISPYSVKELNDICVKEFDRIENKDYFNKFITNCKPMMSSLLYREFHITGVTFSPTAEANVNTLNTTAEMPFTFVHELAHSKGVMRENDAQQVALCLCLTSKNPYLRFSAYYCSIGRLLNLADYTGIKNDKANYVNKLNKNYVNCCNWCNNYWNEHDLLSKFAEWWNNLYLKSSGVEEGTSSYNDKPIEVDPSSKEITSFSTYQKIYFRVYYGGSLL